ncbi:DUF4139 domain-containing protein [Allopusillimonas ginsengisoli]|uniref:DUF4139 domain-containing protein n=1 Tax=Allopusillimonas ginsengisoli TaxID=453575 RepID=UPI00142FC5D7|nr:DUF4139 domain-containing protein [Allopusillimonas ginsengisoli]
MTQPTTPFTPILRHLRLSALPLAIMAALAGVPGSALGATSGRIQAITLSSGGLAEISRSAQVSGGESLQIPVPLEQVDDILKSLVVRDPAGAVGGINLEGLSPVEETFRRLPFSPEQMSSLPALAQALQGVPARATSGGRSIEGIILGVASESAEQHERGEPAPPAHVLSVLADGGQIKTLALGSDAVLDILDDTLSAKIRDAAAVSGRGRTDQMRNVTVTLAGEGERAVGLSYVVPAPVWKTAYRLVTGDKGQARLQAWAIVENATGEDWQDVDVTLSSGAPVTLSQQLLKRYWHTRPEVPVMAQTAAPPRPDGESAVAQSRQKLERMRAMPAHRPAPLAAAGSAGFMADQAYSEVSPPANEALATEGQTSATYAFPKPVNLAAGQIFSAPFIDTQVEAERVSVFRPGSGTHPVAALYLKNDTQASLPPGILTVYDNQEGYVGDAQLLVVPKGESRMASFASDNKVTIRSEQTPKEIISQVAVADGVLKLTQIARLDTTYSITGAADAPRTVIIEHPRREGWRFTSDALDSSTVSSYRLRAALAEGEQADIKAAEEQTRNETFALVDADQEDLLYWSGVAADANTASQLEQLAQLRAGLAQSQGALDTLANERERASQNQARIRDNLTSVPEQSELAQRYLSALGKEEDNIAELDVKIAQARAALDKQRKEMAAFIKNMS